MKKYLVILLSVLFVLGSFSFVIADDGGMDSVRAMKPGAKVMLGGDARVRGTWIKNQEFESDSEDDNRFYDQRIRLKVKGESGNGISANLRLYINNSVQWDGAANACTGCIKVDYAYITVPVSSVTVNAGLKKRYYGNAFMRGSSTDSAGGSIETDQWDQRYETIEVMGKFETVTVTAFTNKQVDTFDSVPGDENLKDFNDYGVILAADVGDIQAGAMVLYHHDNRTTGTTENDDGTDISIYAKGKVQNIGLGAEVVFLTGDLNKDDPTGADKTPLGFMAYAETTVGAIGVRLDAAYAANTYTASYSYSPTLAIGTVQQTGRGDFSSESDSKSWLIAASANTDVMENVNVLGRVAYASVENYDDGTNAVANDDKASFLELDGVVTVQIAKNARYFIEAAYVNPGGDLSDDLDAQVIIANRAELYF